MATRKKRSKVKRATATTPKGTARKSKRAAPIAKSREEEKPSMTDQLKEARKRYTVSKSASGSTSAHNGDDIAALLAGNTPESVCATAGKLAGLKVGELAAKYDHLNPGQVRMCAGNRIRALVKKEAVTVDEVASILASV